MEGSMKELSEYRYRRACEVLQDAEALYREGRFSSSINRAYYATFHGIRAITALDGFDSSKHSGIIAYFNRHYVKTGIFDKSVSKMLDSLFRLREKADYQDFFIISKDMAEGQLQKAESIMAILEPYLEQRWQKE